MKKKIVNSKALAVVLLLTIFLPAQVYSQDWRNILKERIAAYGHRNWIIIADAAYPKQSAPGIETVVTNTGQIQVLKEVLSEIAEAEHIRPIIMFDKELKYVSEENAAGVEDYKKELDLIMGCRDAKEMQHEYIIRKLDEASRLFDVLLLKTNMTIPYTTVFIELDCGYWSAEKENELRRLAKESNK